MDTEVITPSNTLYNNALHHNNINQEIIISDLS
jgi:hypothetical protein